MIIEHDRIPVEISKSYICMEQKFSLFIRGLWDPKIMPLSRKFDENHFNMKPPTGSYGFTNVDRALKTAAWSICNEYAPYNEFGCANTGLYSWQDEKSIDSVSFDNEKAASVVVKNAAKFLGADLVGIADFDQRWVYSSWYDFATKQSVPSKFPFEIKRVIVIAIAMEHSAYLTSPSLISFAATGLGYSSMAVVAMRLATFIRQLGYNAIPSGNDTALNIPMAVQAGLGEVGRNGLLITPQYGPRVRLVKIFTDMPLEPDKPITFGVSQFCIKCKKCAELCPANAIPADPKPTMRGNSISNNPGALKWYTDPERCFKFWASNGGECGNCIACCPYNKWSSWHHGLAQELTQSIGVQGLLKVGKKDEVRNLKKWDYAKVDEALYKTVNSAHDQHLVASLSQLGIAGLGNKKLNKKITKGKWKFADSQEASVIIKKAAKFFGADLVGIANSNDCLYQSVIVIALEIDYEVYQVQWPIKTALAVALGLSRLAETAQKIIVFLQQLGYQAKSSTDNTIQSVPLAIEAGLGEIGRSGLLITKEFGPRVQLLKIYTELDLKTDQPTKVGVKEFCESCKIYSKTCPAETISVNRPNNVEEISIINSCPFNKPTWHEDSTKTIAAAIWSKQNLSASFNKQFNEKTIKSWWEVGKKAPCP